VTLIAPNKGKQFCSFSFHKPRTSGCESVCVRLKERGSSYSFYMILVLYAGYKLKQNRNEHSIKSFFVCMFCQACRHGHVQHLEHLLFYGADMSAQNASGNTALHVCALYNQVTHSIIQYVVRIPLATSHHTHTHTHTHSSSSDFCTHKDTLNHSA